MGRLDGKVIVLTAAAQGIGRAAALVSCCLLLLAYSLLWYRILGPGTTVI